MIFKRWWRQGDGAGKNNTVFWIRVDVCLETPLQEVGDDDKSASSPVKGAIMSFGVTAASEDVARKVIEDWIASDQRFSDLSYRVDYDHIGVIDDLRGELYEDEEVAESLLQDSTNEGMWYRTGVGWYGDDN